MDTSIMLLVLGSAALHAGWNFATRRVKGDVVVMWLSLLVAGTVSSPAAAAWAWSQGDWSLSWHCVAATVLIHTFYFLLVATAYQTGEISMIYPVARGAGVAGTAAIVMSFTPELVSSLALASILSVCIGTVLLGTVGFNPHRSLRALRIALLAGVSIVAYSIVDSQGRVVRSRRSTSLSCSWVRACS